MQTSKKHPNPAAFYIAFTGPRAETEPAPICCKEKVVTHHSETSSDFLFRHEGLLVNGAL